MGDSSAWSRESTFCAICSEMQQPPWEKVGLGRMSVIVGRKRTLFIDGLSSQDKQSKQDKGVQVAYEARDEQTIDVRLLARTLLPTLPDHKPASMYAHYGITGKDGPERMFELFSSLIVGYLKLAPDLLALLAELLPAATGDLVRRLIMFAKTEQASEADEQAPSFPASTVSLADALSPTGPLARDLSSFEERSGQEEMAYLVFDALSRSGTAVVEAGPGTGKTFAYLIPAILYLREHADARVVLSTRTKQLQEQAYGKDIPFLASHLSPSLKVALLKGRRNYVCLRRWQATLGELIEGLERDLLHSLAPLARWLFETTTGDIEENSAFLSDAKARSLWYRLYDDPHRCLGSFCEFYDECFSIAARRRARKADLVVVNHALLLADQQMDQGILGEYQFLIVDEAHALETAARQAFTITLTEHVVDSLLRAIEHPLGRRTGGWLSRLPLSRTDDKIRRAHDIGSSLRKGNASLFASIAQKLPPGRGRSPDLSPFQGEMIAIMQGLDALTRSIETLSDLVDSQENKREADGLIAEADGIVRAFDKIFSAPDENSVCWYEFIGDEPYLHYSPLTVAPFLEDKLFPHLASLTLTSATLSQGGDFRYLDDSLGLKSAPGEASYAVVASPFSYEEKMRMLFTDFLPPVTAPTDTYAAAIADCVQQLLTATDCKIMVLFTSYRLLRAVHEAIGSDVLTLAQGVDGPRAKLVARFKSAKKGTILLGTDSFWEGVDLPGDALELLIITRLPFPVPTDPVFSALADRLSANGRDAFHDLSLPQAILKLRQGVGRLIRTTSDRGIIIITDQRITSKSYGQRFAAALPIAGTNISDMEGLISEVEQWFATAPTDRAKNKP